MKALGHALVVGGGIGGMAAAIALRRHGVAVELIDIDPEWKVYGAGLTITGPTLRAFRRLELLDAIGQHGFFSQGQKLFLFDGTLLGEQTPPPVEPGLPASGGIMRPKLHQIMSDEVRRLGVEVGLGVSVEAIAQSDECATVTFTNKRKSEYDLVVAADGIYSQTRQMLFPGAAAPTYTGQMSWRVVAPRPGDMVKAEFFFGHRHVGGIIPCSEKEVYAFILHPEPQNQRVGREDQPARLKALMADFGGSMAVIREGIGSHSSILARPFEYAFQPKPWHVGRVVLIGDAAHATTPHLASGAGIAVEDALILADELSKADNVPAGLAAFTDRRFDRCKFVVESSVAIGKRQLEGAPPEEIGMRMGQAMGYLAGAI